MKQIGIILKSKVKSAHLLLLMILLVSSFQLEAQFFSIGVDPASVRWEKIESKHYRLIYPKEYQPEAKKIIAKLEFMYVPISTSLNVEPYKTTLIVHNRTIVSNGLTAYAPRRIELYTFQYNSSYAQPWMDQLITHEVRHICQMDKINASTSRMLYLLFGEQIIGGIIGLYIPSWYFEGDAVLTETTLSNSGRGRAPIFTSKLRSTLLSRGVEHYNKSLFGSFRVPVADQYQQGFVLLKESTKRYGPNFWINNLESTALNPFIPNPFFRSFKNQAELSIAKFYKEAMSQLAEKETQRIANTQINDADMLVPKTKRYSNYQSFAIVNDTTLIAVKKQMDKIPQVVLLQNGKEKKLSENSIIVPGSISSKKGVVLWAESQNHPRWSLSSWISIVKFDIATKKRTVIVPESRLQYPSLSHDAKKFVAVKQTLTDSNIIQILSMEGNLEKEIFPPADEIVMQPQWCSGDTAIIAVLLTNQGKRLSRYSLANNQWQSITQPTFHDFLLWQVVGNDALATASWEDNTPVCTISLSDGSTNIVATRPFDIESAQIAPSNKLICSEVTANGNKLYAVYQTSNPKPIGLFSPFTGDEFSHLNRYDSVVLKFPETADTAYIPKPYKKMAHLLNIHSWGPISINADNEINPGLSISSQNSLSSSNLKAGMTYSTAEENVTYYMNYAYTGWFAEMYANAQSTTKRVEKIEFDSTSTAYTWNQSDYSLMFQVPLVYQKPSCFIQNYASIGLSATNYFTTATNPENFMTGNLGAVQLQLYHGVLKRKAFQALQPSWGYTFEFNYKTDVFGEIKAGTIASAECVFYLPGIFRNHGIQLYGGVQDLTKKHMYYSTLLSYPRGYIGTITSNATSASISYRFPIAYPDMSIGSLLYLKRIRGTLYADYLSTESTNIQEYSSAGYEVFFDSYWFRLVAPISIGFRYVNILKENKERYELLFSVNFGDL
jgi:hypothetical protein